MVSLDITEFLRMLMAVDVYETSYSFVNLSADVHKYIDDGSDLDPSILRSVHRTIVLNDLDAYVSVVP